MTGYASLARLFFWDLPAALCRWFAFGALLLSEVVREQIEIRRKRGA